MPMISRKKESYEAQSLLQVWMKVSDKRWTVWTLHNNLWWHKKIHMFTLTVFFKCTPWWTFPNCLIRQLLKELFQGLKGFIKNLLCWWSCPAGSLTRGPSPALMQIYAMRTLSSGRAPSQITQSEFSRKVNSFWWLIRLFSFSLWL